jgi:hypothetical protein
VVVSVMTMSVIPTGMAAVPATTSDRVKRRCGEADDHDKNSAPASVRGRSHADFLSPAPILASCRPHRVDRKGAIIASR